MGYCDSEAHEHPVFEQVEELVQENKKLRTDLKKITDSQRTLRKELNDIAFSLGAEPSYVSVMRAIGDLRVAKNEQETLAKHTLDALLAERSKNDDRAGRGVLVDAADYDRVVEELEAERKKRGPLLDSDYPTLRFIRASVEDDRARTGKAEWFCKQYDAALALLDVLEGSK